MSLSNQAAYLKGLADGMKLSEKESDEAKLLGKIIDMLGDLSETVDELSTFSDEITDLVNTIDEDLGDVESILYDADEISDEDEGVTLTDDPWEDAEDSEEEPVEEADTYEDEEYEYEVTCPECKKTIILPESVIAQGKTNCPYCGEVLAFDLAEEDAGE